MEVDALESVQWALAALSDDALARLALASATPDTPSPGLLAWLGTAVDWEEHRKTRFSSSAAAVAGTTSSGASASSIRANR